MCIIKLAEIRKQELLDCAIGLFATRGYAETSINQIISALGISKAAFYHHYSSKEDLIEALAERAARIAADRARHVLEDPALDAFERLSVFLSMMRTSKIESPPEFNAAFAVIFQPGNSALYERSQAATAAVVQPILARIIAEGVADRTFDTSDPNEAAEIIIHLMSSTRGLVGELCQTGAADRRDDTVARLLKRMAFLATVVDRILGIPEGSITFVDESAVQDLTDNWRSGVCAA